MSRSVTRAVRAQRRQDAEVRQSYYDSLTTQQKLNKPLLGAKERDKLTKRLAQEQRVNS